MFYTVYAPICYFPSTEMLEFFYRATFSLRSQRASLISVIPQSFATTHVYLLLSHCICSARAWTALLVAGGEPEPKSKNKRKRKQTNVTHWARKLFKHKNNNRTNYKTNRIKKVWTEPETKLLRKINDGIEKNRHWNVSDCVCWLQLRLKWPIDSERATEPSFELIAFEAWLEHTSTYTAAQTLFVFSIYRWKCDNNK